MIKLNIGTAPCGGDLCSRPAPYFKFEGPLVCEGPQNHLIGCFCDQDWEIFGATAKCMQCTDRVVVRFQDWQDNASADCGPFEHLNFSEEVCYAGDLPLAKYIDEKSCWQRDSDGSYWPRMLLLAAETASAKH